LEEITRQSVGEITHGDWIEACDHVKTTEERYWRKNGLMTETTENLIVIWEWRGI
jgi:hypothetical protein